MKSEYDFSQTESGKFYHSDAKFHDPIYLEPDVEEFLTKMAEHKKIDIQVLVNEWLRNTMKLI
ncbi:hypothetical protein ACL6C3_09830 [Capilliphycus salinus ALCB114379]|uniref:hypothetical protein n=1 Tax=Capilliphycus salinus TaxID=2768948 RepID=UPI0039A4F087